MNSKRQKSLIKHHLHKNQPWRVLLEYVTATAAQVHRKLTTCRPQVPADSPSRDMSRLSWNMSRLSWKTCGLSTWPGVPLLSLCLFYPRERGDPGKSLHVTISLPKFFLPSNKVPGFADFTSDFFHKSSALFIPVCFTLALKKTLNHTRKEVTRGFFFFYSSDLQADYTLEDWASMWNQVTK